MFSAGYKFSLSKIMCYLNYRLWQEALNWYHIHKQHCLVYVWVFTHWGRVTHIFVGNITIIGSGNVLSPGRRQAIIWTNAGILLIGPIGTNFSEILIKIITFSFKKMRWKVSSGKRRPSCLGLNVLMPFMASQFTVNSLAPQRCESNHTSVFFKFSFQNFYLNHILLKWSKVSATELHWW